MDAGRPPAQPAEQEVAPPAKPAAKPTLEQEVALPAQGEPAKEEVAPVAPAAHGQPPKEEVAPVAPAAHGQPPGLGVVPRADYGELSKKHEALNAQVQAMQQTAHDEKVALSLNNALKARVIAPASVEYHKAQCSAGKASPTKTRPWLNKRTGQTERVLLGIDPGWVRPAICSAWWGWTQRRFYPAPNP